MSRAFFDHPIPNSPYEYRSRHWELDSTGQPTQRVAETRRRADFATPIPKPKKQKGAAAQQQGLAFEEHSTAQQQCSHAGIINGVRAEVDKWRVLPDPNSWGVTPETARLLQHWRHHAFNDVRPFFCQAEAVETAIWLTEVAPPARQARRTVPGASGQRQQRSQPRPRKAGAQAGHRCGQDHRDGHAHRLANWCRPTCWKTWAAPRS